MDCLTPDNEVISDVTYSCIYLTVSWCVCLCVCVFVFVCVCVCVCVCVGGCVCVYARKSPNACV